MEQAFQQCEISKWPTGNCREIARLVLGLEELEAKLGIRFVDDDKDDAEALFRCGIKLSSGEQFLLITYVYASGIEVHADAETPQVDALLRFLDATGLPDTCVSWAPNTVYRIVAIPGQVQVYCGERIIYSKGMPSYDFVADRYMAQGIGLNFILVDERRRMISQAIDRDSTTVSTAPVPRRVR